MLSRYHDKVFAFYVKTNLHVQSVPLMSEALQSDQWNARKLQSNETADNIMRKENINKLRDAHSTFEDKPLYGVTTTLAVSVLREKQKLQNAFLNNTNNTSCISLHHQPMYDEQVCLLLHSVLGFVCTESRDVGCVYYCSSNNIRVLRHARAHAHDVRRVHYGDIM